MATAAAIYKNFTPPKYSVLSDIYQWLLKLKNRL